MTDLPFLNSYSGQSTDDLIALEGTYRTDSIVLALEESLMNKANPSKEELTVLAVEALEREVNNGGFSQFFVNSSREYTFIVADALIAIGCPRTAELFQKAIAVLRITPSHTDDNIENLACFASDEQDEALNELDDIYYRGDEEPISGKLFEFIKLHRSKIAAGGA